MEHARAYQLVEQVLYSEEMKKLHRTRSPMAGFSDAGEAAVACRSMAEYAAVNNHLNADYCGLLALLSFFNADSFPCMAAEAELMRDLKGIKQAGPEECSAEARCTARVLQTVADIRVLDPAEMEKRGGWSVAVCAAVDEITTF